MERMLVVVFDNEKKAFEGESALTQLQSEGLLTIYEKAVIVKHAEGTVSLKQVDEAGPLGSLAGTAVGGLIGLLGGPVGAAVGAASGLALGALYDVDDARVGGDFLDDVSKSLTPNKVAVVAEVEEEWTTPVDTRMESLGGTVLRRALWDVRKSVDEEEIGAMKADLAQLKSEASKANAARRAKLQKKIDQLQAKVDAQFQKSRAAARSVRGAPECEERRPQEERRRRRRGPSRTSRIPPSETRKPNKGGSVMATETLSRDVSRHAGWSIFMGILTAAVGAAMIVYPLATATASTVFFGALLLVAAVAQFVFAFTSDSAGQFFLKLLLGLLYGISGLCLIAVPGIGVVTLTVVLGAMLITDAVVEAFLGFSAPAGAGRGWFFFSGFFSLLLGILILAQWPASSIWAIGTMVGAAVLFSGITRVVTSSWVRSEAREFQRSSATA